MRETLNFGQKKGFLRIITILYAFYRTLWGCEENLQSKVKNCTKLFNWQVYRIKRTQRVVYFPAALIDGEKSRKCWNLTPKKMNERYLQHFANVETGSFAELRTVILKLTSHNVEIRTPHICSLSMVPIRSASELIKIQHEFRKSASKSFFRGRKSIENAVKFDWSIFVSICSNFVCWKLRASLQSFIEKGIFMPSGKA